MSLVSILIILIAVGVVLYLVNMIPMDGKIKKILNVVVVAMVVLWLLSVFHVLPSLTKIRI
jgi:hypothetical protein